jgi:signal transduction histidine kinase
MSEEEYLLLENRLGEWNRLYRRNLVALALAFGAAVLLLIFNFRMLLAEVGQTKETERRERDNSESYRALSARILELQDKERRRVARDLHDSVGQYLAGLKINLSRLESGRGGSTVINAKLFPETLELVDLAIAEVRTISHLLHPPLLDELGFDSAARWYVDEFAKRGGVKVTLTLGEIVERLPRSIELALFRILQESLTNVHRHSHASTVTVEVECHDDKVFLTVRDDGKGVRPEVLRRFRAGMAAGVGLAGMKERVAELNGELKVESSGQGTTISVALPTSACETAEKEPTVTTHDSN